MTQDEIIKMAHEAGTTFVAQYGVASVTPEWLERFASLVTAAEREACAKACDQIADDLHPFTDAWYNVCASAAAIRARGGE